MSDRVDIHSYAEPERVRVTHCSLDLEVDFERQQLRGTATLALERHDPDAPLILDTRDLIVDVGELGPRDPILGAPLRIELAKGANTVRIGYETQPHASGLQWLSPEQTAGKRHPFLFSQSQSIHARSWIPIQDSPGIRVTYDARITAPDGLLVVMSAEREGVDDGVHSFSIELPIPAYLIAIAVGDLHFAPLGPRTGIYAEPPVLDAAAREFEDTERMVAAVEHLYGPYRWGRYELLILPPSFPFGGMENPIVTFATPTILAGDKSLVGLVSHELAHSWSGNLVTNATWSDFWLNEGFTTYIENRIQEEVYGREQALMEQVLDWRELAEELAAFPPRDQILHVDLAGRDPDEGCTRVPYIKGALLLRSMEQAVGRDRFDAFLRSYFQTFAFRSITTEQALDFMRPLFPNIDWQAWVYEPGLPASAPQAVSERLQLAADESSDPTKWNTQEWLEFLQTRPRPVDVAALDERFGLMQSKNAEILFEWLLLAIEQEYRPAYGRVEQFLMSVGRMRFLRPLYRALVKTSEGEELAARIYERARPLYHPIAQHAIDRILLLQEKTAGEERVDP